MPNFNVGHIQLHNISLKTKLQALAEQRGQSLNDTIKLVIEAGIVALTADPFPATDVRDFFQQRIIEAGAQSMTLAVNDPAKEGSHAS